MRESFLGSDADVRSPETPEDVAVYRVTDYASSDLLAALELCNQMIPVQERQGTPEEIIRTTSATRESGGLKGRVRFKITILWQNWPRQCAATCSFSFTPWRSSPSSVSSWSALVFRSESKWHG